MRPPSGLAVLLLVVLVAPARGQDDPAPTPVATACHVRSGPSYAARPVGEVAVGATPERLGTAGHWVRVRFREAAAYVHDSCFATPAEAALLARTRWVPEPAPRVAPGWTVEVAPAAPDSVRPPASAKAPSAATLPATVRSSCPLGRPLVRGPRGGCYFVTDSGRRSYVDRGCCEG